VARARGVRRRWSGSTRAIGRTELRLSGRVGRENPVVIGDVAVVGYQEAICILERSVGRGYRSKVLGDDREGRDVDGRNGRIKLRIGSDQPIERIRQRIGATRSEGCTPRVRCSSRARLQDDVDDSAGSADRVEPRPESLLLFGRSHYLEPDVHTRTRLHDDGILPA
jgi:hypothetical protein